MRDGAVGFGHAVGVLVALDGGAGVVGGVHKLGIVAGMGECYTLRKQTNN